MLFLLLFRIVCSSTLVMIRHIGPSSFSTPWLHAFIGSKKRSFCRMSRRNRKRNSTFYRYDCGALVVPSSAIGSLARSRQFAQRWRLCARCWFRLGLPIIKPELQCPHCPAPLSQADDTFAHLRRSDAVRAEVDLRHEHIKQVFVKQLRALGIQFAVKPRWTKRIIEGPLYSKDLHTGVDDCPITIPRCAIIHTRCFCTTLQYKGILPLMNKLSVIREMQKVREDQEAGESGKRKNR